MKNIKKFGFVFLAVLSIVGNLVPQVALANETISLEPDPLYFGDYLLESDLTHDIEYFPDNHPETDRIMDLAEEVREMLNNGVSFDELDQHVTNILENPRLRGKISNYITGKLNKEEQKLYNNNKAKALLCMANGKLAIKYSEGWYKSSSLHNGNGDAFRHILWNYGMTIDVGASFAKKWSDAHENGTPNNPALEKKMDLHNNAIGIKLGKDNPKTVSHSTFKTKSREKVRNGSARIISGSSLVKSGKTGEK